MFILHRDYEFCTHLPFAVTYGNLHTSCYYIAPLLHRYLMLAWQRACRSGAAMKMKTPVPLFRIGAGVFLSITFHISNPVKNLHIRHMGETRQSYGNSLPYAQTSTSRDFQLQVKVIPLSSQFFRD